MGYDLKNEIERWQASIMVDLNETACSLLSAKERLKFNDRIKENMHKLNMLIFDYESNVYSRKQNIKMDKNKIEMLIDSIKEYNSVEPSREPSKYIDLQKEIKNSFESLAKKDFSMQNYFNLCETNSVSKEKKGESDNMNSEMKNRKIGEKKIASNASNKNSLPPKRKINVPFLTDKECKSRAVSKPTYINKDELIKTIVRLGLGKHFKNPLQSYTKDQLCEGYFEHHAK